MSVFTAHLKNVSSLAHCGLELLVAFRDDFYRDISVQAADLRVVLYALQIIFDGHHLARKEKHLFPALIGHELWAQQGHEANLLLATNSKAHQLGRQRLLQLRQDVDNYELNQISKNLVIGNLSALIELIQNYLEVEEKKIYALANELLNPAVQHALLRKAQSDEQSLGQDLLQAPRVIFNQLRMARGIYPS